MNHLAMTCSSFGRYNINFKREKQNYIHWLWTFLCSTGAWLLVMGLYCVDSTGTALPPPLPPTQYQRFRRCPTDFTGKPVTLSKLVGSKAEKTSKGLKLYYCYWLVLSL